MAKYKVTTQTGIETVDATSIKLDGPHLIMMDGTDIVAVFAPHMWSNVVLDQPDTFGDATKAVSG